MKPKATMTNSTPTDERIQALLLWLRRERIVCTEITVGDVSLAINDFALSQALMAESRIGTPAAATVDGSDEEGRRNLYEQFGGKAIDEVAKEEQTTYEDDDE